MKSLVRINLRPALAVLLIALVASGKCLPNFRCSCWRPISRSSLLPGSWFGKQLPMRVAANNNSAKHMFRSRKQTPQGSQTRLYVETRDAMAGMTIAYNDKPLAPQDMQNENGRLAGLASNAELAAPQTCPGAGERRSHPADRKSSARRFSVPIRRRGSWRRSPGCPESDIIAPEVSPQSCIPASYPCRTGSRRHEWSSCDRSGGPPHRANRRDII